MYRLHECKSLETVRGSRIANFTFCCPAEQAALSVQISRSNTEVLLRPKPRPNMKVKEVAMARSVEWIVVLMYIIATRLVCAPLLVPPFVREQVERFDFVTDTVVQRLPHSHIRTPRSFKFFHCVGEDGAEEVPKTF